MSAPYPWLQPQWQALGERHARDRIGHAYLLSGREGLGKSAFAEAVAQTLLCEAPGSTFSPCCGCRSCLLYQAGNHPDVKLLAPEEDRKSIVIDQVRALIEFFTLKSHYGRRKIGIVDPADSMHHAAANALLKILEEPPAEALLLLVAHRPALLPATVLSRCQRLHFAQPPWPDRLAWVSAQTPPGATTAIALDQLTWCGAPLQLLEQVTSARPQLFNDIIATLRAAFARGFDPLAAARNFADVDIRRFLDAIELSVQAAVQLGAGHAPAELLLAPASQRLLQEISDKLNFDSLLRYLDQIGASRAIVQRSSGVRSTEIIESLWCMWMKATQTEFAV